MSTAVGDAGGVVVISQVRPQSDRGNGPEEGETGAAPSSTPKQIVAFYKGEPEVLGTTQIFTGILFIAIGILMSTAYRRRYYYHMSIVAHTGLTIWTGMLFIISGSLSVAASVKPTVGKIILIGVNFFNLMLFLLMFCITISTSVFGCKTVCRSSFNETVVVIYQTTPLNVPDTTKDGPPDSTAALTSAFKTQT
ncbi:membrane-spanning 4-domains subfamily A member 4A-like isoform X2 [Ranitomeya imitator]|uniref:membrane-spanning 4-domains subfamily A member 4A-like isoform X2 n=1 Tax=Ranitomeya imitator TaxID=111125 RepID=UPI0037E855AB